MRRVILTAWVGVSICLSTGVASAGDFWHRVHVDYHRNTCWPYPFVYQDRDAVRTPFAIMADNGWRLENTLPDELFDPENQTLSRAGERKVRWIATQAPTNRRVVFVPRGTNEEITSARVEAVQNYLSTMSLRGPGPQVFVTDILPASTSGDYFYQVDKKAEASLPEPRLPAADATPGGGSR